MLRFVVRRAISMFVVLLALCALVFTVGRFGGDPVRGYLGPNASQAVVAETRNRLGFDDPIWVQFIRYLDGLVHGDFGMSMATRTPVATELTTRFPATLELAFAAMVLAVVIALLLAWVYTLRGPLARVVRFVMLSGASAPSFLVAVLGILIFFVHLGWLPVSGRTSYGASSGLTGMYVVDGIITGNLGYTLDALRHLILPALAASLAPGVALARVLADGLSTSMDSGYSRTARALGQRESQILRRHALRNSVSPMLSVLGVQLGMLLSSLVVVEKIFSWNGLGQYLVRAISAADTTSVASITLVLGAFYVIVNALVDISLAIVDPRVRLK